jgi:hypothetical protein
MAIDHDKSQSRMSIEMNENTAIKRGVNDNDERIIVSALEESNIRKAVSFREPHLPSLKRKLTFISPQFDRRVVPIVCIAYVLSYLDRGNIGNAKYVDDSIPYIFLGLTCWQERPERRQISD